MDMHKNLPKRWLIAPVVPASMHEELKDYPPIFQQILYNRGIQSAEAAAKFLSADIPINEPHLLKDMQKGAERVQRAIDNQEKILVLNCTKALFKQSVLENFFMIISYQNLSLKT